ncbi:MAG: hypothetical protein AMXMBFR56_36760 [Polyangiaceae bacterium]
MRGSLKLVFGFGLLSVVALGTPACGDDDDGGGGSGGGKGGSGGSTGGSGGSGGGTAGSGGASGGGGTAGSGGSGGGGITCGSNQCQDYKVAGFLDLKGCCAGTAKDKCGGDVNTTIATLTGLPTGCYEIGQPGNLDSNCAPLVFTGLDGGPAQIPGCCNSVVSKCGYMANFTSVGGPNFGCVDGTGVVDGGPASCTPSTGDAGTDAATEGGSDAATDSSTD